jgi:hypothetical protein
LTYASPPPSYFKYFANPRLGGFTNYMDYCPFVLPWNDGKCAQPASGAASCMQGFNVFSDSARCVDVDFRPKLTNSLIHFYKGLCAGFVCNAPVQEYTVVVYGSNISVQCPPGQNISLSAGSDAFEAGSYITCPPYMEVCQGNVKGAMDYESMTHSSASSSKRKASPGAVSTSLIASSSDAVDVLSRSDSYASSLTGSSAALPWDSSAGGASSHSEGGDTAMSSSPTYSSASDTSGNSISSSSNNKDHPSFSASSSAAASITSAGGGGHGNGASVLSSCRTWTLTVVVTTLF